MFGKPGRPREDRLLRQREIYQAVSPLIFSIGARKITMRQAAATANMSIGGLYHYFPDKRALLLHALQPEAFARICEDFHAQYGHLMAVPGTPDLLDPYIEFQVREVFFLRPAIHAALEIGADAFWKGVENGLAQGIDGFVAVLKGMVADSAERDLLLLARSLRRTLVAAVLDTSITAEELRDELRALIEGHPIGTPVGRYGSQSPPPTPARGLFNER